MNLENRQLEIKHSIKNEEKKENLQWFKSYKSLQHVHFLSTRWRRKWRKDRKIFQELSPKLSRAGESQEVQRTPNMMNQKLSTLRPIINKLSNFKETAFFKAARERELCTVESSRESEVFFIRNLAGQKELKCYIHHLGRKSYK